MSQLGGGIGTRGPGETQLETDRRKIQRRLLQLKRELEDVRRVRGQQRHRRAAVPVPTIALVGYTNAGKSTLFNRLTDAGVLASSRMFSTLDPKLRALVLPSTRKVLLSDTVGFISNLPHTLITSFRATLEEVEKAEVLLHVQDCSSPQREQQKEDVEKVLAELGSLSKPILPVLNKMDLLPPAERSAWAADKVDGGRLGANGRRHSSPARVDGSGSHCGSDCRSPVHGSAARRRRIGGAGRGSIDPKAGIFRRFCRSGSRRASFVAGTLSPVWKGKRKA